jgi:hypothetical protein
VPGDTIELREHPKAPATKPRAAMQPVAGVMTLGTVKSLEMQQWTIRSEASPREERSETKWW